MVYYIRFLKIPRVQTQKAGSLSISALICITTDLGDAFLAEDADLLATLTPAGHREGEKVLAQERLVWKAGKREVLLSLGPFPPNHYMQKHPVVLGVTPSDSRGRAYSSSDDVLRVSDGSAVPLVISGWSSAFGGSSSVSEKLVERRFGPKDILDLRIWEETGNSIARHIWDAAIASIIYLRQITTSHSPSRKAPNNELSAVLDTLFRATHQLKAIELGSGCGIVGIALAQMLSNLSMILTDLPEVEEIITKNINISSGSLSSSSSVIFQSLDWDDPEPTLEGSADFNNLGLILISDCTYNADSQPALISVIEKLLQRSPGAVVLVALKRRHESESVFFDLMRGVGLLCLGSDAVPLPGQFGEKQDIEFYWYRSV